MQLGSWSPDLHVICLLFRCHSRDHSATITDVIDGFWSGTFPALTETTPPKGRVVTFIRHMARGVNGVSHLRHH